MGFKNCEGLFKKRKCKITTGPTSSLFNLSSHKMNNTMLPTQDTSTQKPATKSYKCQKDNFSITSGVFFNARSIVNKIFELKALLLSQDFTFVFITETWLKPFYPDSFLDDSDLFRALRCDRLFDRGGGVCVIYKTSLAPMISRVKINNSDCPGFEIIAFNFHYSKSKFSRFICIYLPPS